MSQLQTLLQQCTVKLTLPGRTGRGTGFFVAPGQILTCNHVVSGSASQLADLDQRVIVQLQTYENCVEALVQKSLPAYDLALLRFEPSSLSNPPCVYLNEDFSAGHALYAYGYSEEFPQGASLLGECEGDAIENNSRLILFKETRVRSGMSGAPLLNQRTGKVCGMVKFTHNRSFDLGGGAIPTSVILDQFPELVEQQRLFHQRDKRWNDLVAKLSSDASQPKQTVKKILMLSANPENPVTRSRRKETKEIREALKRAKHSDLFELLERPDINAAELSQELTTIEPYIINISGHENGIEGLILEGNCEITTFKTPEKLIADLFKFHAKSVQCIILNGCYSDVQAREIVQHIDFVIGIGQELEDIKVINFLVEFYYQLGSKKTIIEAYDISYNYLQRQGIEDVNLPILLSKFHEIKLQKLEKCDKKIEKALNNIELWSEKGTLLKDLGRAEEAKEAYEKASSLAPNDYEIRTEQGDALKQLEKYEEAVNAYDKALELQPEDYKVWWKKGQALVEGEKYSEAVESYDKAVVLAVKLDPPSPDRYIICREYASLLERLGEYQKSIFMYKKSLGFEPKYRTSSYLKKQVYKKMYSGMANL